MGVANEELDESYLESLESALADELSFTFDFEQLDSKELEKIDTSNKSKLKKCNVQGCPCQNE